jgi:hypothetical protein
MTDFWIETVPFEEADGLCKEEYDAAIKRAGRIWNIVRSMSINARAMRDSMQMYMTLMYRQSDLSRVQREALATITSKTNRCHY